MNTTSVQGMRVCIALGVLFAAGAALEPDNLSLCLGCGAASAAFLTIAGLFALAARMPMLPALVLPKGSMWQARVRAGEHGDRLARLELMEVLDLAAGVRPRTAGTLVQTRREEVLGMNRSEFDRFLQEQLASVEGSF